MQHTFMAPQKGGTEEMLEKLEKGMISYRKILEEYLGHSIEEIEGLGAAGGLGACFIWIFKWKDAIRHRCVT